MKSQRRGMGSKLMTGLRLVCLFGALFTAGCASYDAQNSAATKAIAVQREQLQSVTARDQFSIQNPERLENGLKTRYKIDSASGAVLINGQQAFYRVFALAPFEKPYFLELLPSHQRVASNMLAMTITSTTVLPGLSYLDEHGAVIKSIVPAYRHEDDRYFSLAGDFGYASICDSRVRFVAVHGVPATYGVKREAVTESYSQYGTTSVLGLYYYGPSGEFRFGIPEKAVGKRIFGANKVIVPCQGAEESIEDFSRRLRERGKGKPQN
jgi:hypothetical protein